MSTDRDTTRIVRSWLEDGVTQLPGSVLDGVLDQLPATHQRRATWWRARRPFEMNKILAFSAAAVAIVVVAIVGIGLFGPTGPNFGAPEETPIVTPTPEAQALVVGAHGPGTFTTTPGGDNPDENPPRITFDMPEGWSATQPFFISSESGRKPVLPPAKRPVSAIRVWRIPAPPTSLSDRQRTISHLLSPRTRHTTPPPPATWSSMATTRSGWSC